METGRNYSSQSNGHVQHASEQCEKKGSEKPGQRTGKEWSDCLVDPSTRDCSACRWEPLVRVVRASFHFDRCQGDEGAMSNVPRHPCDQLTAQENSCCTMTCW